MQQEIERWVRQNIEDVADPPLLFVSGAQGIGKSTALKSLENLDDLRIAVIGIDDVYLSREARLGLSRTVHLLCETRGPPGTHDLALLTGTIERLVEAGPKTITPMPVFDKRSDDRVAEPQWRTYRGRPDAIVVEGWLLGVDPNPESPQQAPINRLESEHDSGGEWRAWQEDNLQSDYAALWNRVDAFLHLDAPSFDVVLKWRLQQEETTHGLESGTLSQDRVAWVENFVQHFERMTRRMLDGGRRDGAVLDIDAERNVR